MMQFSVTPSDSSTAAPLPDLLTVVANLGIRALAGDAKLNLFEEAVELIVGTLEAEACFILEYDPNAAQLIYRAGYGWKDPSAIRFDLLNRDGVGTALFASGVQALADFSADARFANDPIFSTAGLQSGLNVKIFGLSAPYGVLGVYYRHPHTFSEREIGFSQSIANLLATAIYRNQGHENLKKLTLQLENEVMARGRLVQLLQDVTAAAGQAETVTEAMRSALDLICRYTGWEVGHVFLRDPFKPTVMLSSPIWAVQDPVRFESFIGKTHELKPIPGQGLPGKVLESGKLALRNHIPTPEYARAAEAAACGLGDGLAFPVLVEKEMVAILEFYSLKPMGVNLSLIEALDNIATQLGRVVERKQAEESLRSSQRQLAQAQKLAHMGSYEWDILNNRVSWSEEMYRIYGASSEDFAGSVEAFLDRVHPEDRQRTQAILAESLEQGRSFEFTHRIIRPDGDVRILRAQGQLVLNNRGRPVKVIGVGQDITEQVLADEKLRAGEELLRRVVTAAPLIIWSIDREGKIILADGRGLSELKLDPEALIGQSIFDLLSDTPQIAADMRRALAGEEVATEIIGDKTNYEARYVPIRNDENEVIGAVGMALNINERVEMENALRASEARFRTIFESSAVGKAIIDLQATIIVTNNSLQQMLGYSNAELVGRRMTDLLLPLDFREHQPAYADFFNGDVNFLQLEQRMMHKEHRLVWGSFTFTWIRKETGEPWFAILMVENITTRKQVEAELDEVKRQLVVSREAERLRLAQELHDEPLQELYSVMYTLSDFEQYIQAEKGLKELHSTQEQVSHLINSLRGICRELRPPTLAPFGLEGAIRELAEHFENDHPGIKLDLDLMYDGQDLDEQLRLTLYRIVQQSLSNIVRHAHATEVQIRFSFNADEIELVIKDNGVGFDVPKRWISMVRQGHLGLAGAAERVETVDGKLNVTSQPGKGVTIQVIVPRHGAAEIL